MGRFLSILKLKEGGRRVIQKSGAVDDVYNGWYHLIVYSQDFRRKGEIDDPSYKSHEVGKTCVAT